MGYNTDDLELASPFKPLPGEANFGPTLEREVKGGAHIAPHAIMTDGERLAMITWRNGLPRHDQGGPATRFPHGLMHFGESFEQCASRLCADQAGAAVGKVRIACVYSYVDDANHWHMEPILVTWIDGNPTPRDPVEGVTWFEGPTLPPGAVWRGKPPFEGAYHDFILPLLKMP